ncbi:hypothetical protein PMAYCL1PPCAC_14785, partial [Pristionchus mayeri]
LVYVLHMASQFAGVNSLLFGGGCFLIEAGNAVRTRSPSNCCSSWFIHFCIALFSALVSLTSDFCSSPLE